MIKLDHFYTSPPHVLKPPKSGAFVEVVRDNIMEISKLLNVSTIQQQALFEPTCGTPYLLNSSYKLEILSSFKTHLNGHRHR